MRWARITLLLLGGCQPGGRPAAPPAPAPAEHPPGFDVVHGRGLPLAADCTACHGVDPCARCHTTRPPRDHTPGFGRRPHAFAARFDPDRCARCHQVSFCADCH